MGGPETGDGGLSVGGHGGNSASVLSFKGVSKRFGDREVLREVSLDIALSGLTFVIGPSGSGKSVLCRLAVGLLRPDAGEVHLWGQRIDDLPERALRGVRARLPYVVQGSGLLDWLSLAGNVALALPRSERPDSVEEALARVGLGDMGARFPSEVGPGIRKRAAIARALVLKPPALILDEPTTGLDSEARAQVNETLELLRDQGLCAIVVSHDREALDRLADAVVSMSQGVLAFAGPKRDFKGGASSQL